MKTVIQFLAMFIAISGFAQGGDGGKKSVTSEVSVVSEQDSEIYELHFNRKQTDAVKVRICNTAEAVIFEEIINENSTFIRPYNLSRLPKDNYFIEVFNGNSLYRRSLSKELDLNSDFIRQVRINAVASAANKYQVAVTNNAGKNISINIFNKDGSLIYSAEEEIELQFAKIYDLSKVNSSQFTIEISDKFGVIETVRIQEPESTLATVAAGFSR